MREGVGREAVERVGAASVVKSTRGSAGGSAGGYSGGESSRLGEGVAAG